MNHLNTYGNVYNYFEKSKEFDINLARATINMMFNCATDEDYEFMRRFIVAYDWAQKQLPYSNFVGSKS